MNKRFLAVSVVLLAVGFCSGFVIGNRAHLPRNNAAFHDLRISHIRDFPPLVDPRHKTIRALASELKTPEAAYGFVRDRIRFAPASPDASAASVLRNGEGSCLGKAALLCSLYRAMGLPPTAVRIITGTIAVSDYMTDHAWVDLEYGQACFQQDPSGMLGVFDFAQFPGM
ncbi:MAG TPA: transglutaminase-like domain-containing protein, partial [Candidatus Deferrimicrobiaceae bacterium]